MRNMYFVSKNTADKYFRDNYREIKDGIYCLNNDIAIKKYDREKSLIVCPEYSDSWVLQFKDIDVAGFSFNKALVYTGIFNIYAIITKFVEGESIKCVPLSSYSIDDVITAIDLIDKAISEISYLGIRVNDIHHGNVIFDGNKITMIDTTEYSYNKNDSQLYEKNMIDIMDILFKSVFYYVGKNKIIRHIYNVHKYLGIRKCDYADFREFEYLMNPAETLMKIRKFMEDDFGVKLNTFGECHSYVDDVINADYAYKRVLKK